MAVAAGRSPSPVNILEKVTSLFPLWVLSLSVAGWIKPMLFLPLSPFITPSLALVMFAMGLTLSPTDFIQVFKNWKWVLTGFIAQYTIMPSLAYILSVYIFKLPYDLCLGLILVGCCPGGTASNLVSMIAGADVALSVLMTTASTVAAIVVTPLLITLSIQSLPKSASSMVSNAMRLPDLVTSVMSVVLVPVISGLAVNSQYPDISSHVSSTYSPSLSVVAVALICGTVSAAARSSSGSVAIPIPSDVIVKLLAATTALHSLGNPTVISVKMMTVRPRCHTRRRFVSCSVCMPAHCPSP